MSTTKDEIISVLNDLIETCKDGQQGFLEAAEAVGDSDLRNTFNVYSQQRARFAGELQNEVLRQGGDPAKTGHVSAKLHRGWMNLKAAITSKSEASIIAECERGEDSAVANYEEALKKHLPAALETLVLNQFRQVQEAHKRIRDLEKVRKAG